MTAVVAEPVQHNGVEDVVSTNGASEVQQDETTEVGELYCLMYDSIVAKIPL